MPSYTSYVHGSCKQFLARHLSNGTNLPFFAKQEQGATLYARVCQSLISLLRNISVSVIRITFQP